MAHVVYVIVIIWSSINHKHLYFQFIKSFLNVQCVKFCILYVFVMYHN